MWGKISYVLFDGSNTSKGLFFALKNKPITEERGEMWAARRTQRRRDSKSNSRNMALMLRSHCSRNTIVLGILARGACCLSHGEHDKFVTDAAVIGFDNKEEH
jgi:hypothetical protein